MGEMAVSAAFAYARACVCVCVCVCVSVCVSVCASIVTGVFPLPYIFVLTTNSARPLPSFPYETASISHRSSKWVCNF